jgi:exodeoxyribonuclease V gamma subunit
MLHVHRAERADGLADMLGELIADPLEDAMAAEVVAVPTRGIERWLSQRLAGRLGSTPGRGDGVCANVDFPFPQTLLGGAVAAASGLDQERDPWTPERLVWPLLEVVDQCLGEPWLAALAAHLSAGGPGDGARRFAAARHIAGLFDRYSVHRPGLVRAWAAGDDQGVTPDSRWQAELWRRLRTRIAYPSPPERLAGACARLRDAAIVANLPGRLSLFGLTRLPASQLDVLDALAVHRDVHLFLLHPSPVLWARLKEPLRRLPGVVPRREDPTAGLASNPLLASWGQDAREMQLVLAGVAGSARTDRHRSVHEHPTTLLERVQADIRADRAPPGVPLQPDGECRALLDPADRSIEVHACHGRPRQVEVLRHAILHLLNDQPGLEPRDVIVMCPDIETFAPLIHATFGLSGPEDDTGTDGLPDLRVRLADRSLRQTNPVLAVVARLLDLAGSRVTATQVLDLAAQEPVRHRFGLDDDDLARLEEWVVGAGVRWGLDASHRASFKLQALDANTWRAGLDRVLLGVAMPEVGQRLFGGVLPLDDVDSGDIDLIGRIAELMDRVEAAVDAFTGIQPISDWATSIARVVDGLCATSDLDAWQLAELQRLLDDVIDEATGQQAASPVPLGLSDVTALLADRLKGRPTRANFRTGHLTFCTLVPMRSVPHKVVCLLGLDDGVFPRHTARDGDDLILGDPWTGDRDARSEDRQLLLDALLAATDRLLITYSGRDERTNLERPPAVPVGELLDVIDRTVHTPGLDGARAQIVVHHPLQPFDRRNFVAGDLIPTQPWSFDEVNLDGARALQRPKANPAPFLRRALPDLDTAVVELDQLERFVRHPVGAFLRLRLGIWLGDRRRDVDDALPVELDNLERWAVAERLLTARLAGADMDACAVAERARGLLPPGGLADPILDAVAPVVEQLVAAARDGRQPRSFDVHVDLPDGTSVVGAVGGVRGDVLHRVTYSRLAAHHRLLAWVRVLALTAARPERPFEALTIGRGRDGARRATVTVAHIPAVAGDAATRRAAACRQLARIVELFRMGMREPLPLYCRTSAAWAEAARSGADRMRAAGRQWTSEWNFPREDRDPVHLLILGAAQPLATLLDEPPTDREHGEGWDATETSRFGRYARRLWDDLLACEEVSDH